jgi:hypothetical protein
MGFISGAGWDDITLRICKASGNVFPWTLGEGHAESNIEISISFFNYNASGNGFPIQMQLLQGPIIAILQFY